MIKADFELYTDGGGDRAGVAASAAIVIDKNSHQQWNVVLHLAGATNNEAEISGALLGLSLLKVITSATGKEGPVTIDWYADSEYTLKGATQYIHGWKKNGWKTASKDPVKNQGLWRAWILLSEGFRISAHHVRGHSGHVLNEACDGACNWAKAEGSQFLSIKGEGGRIEIPNLEGAAVWSAFSGEEFLNGLRETNPAEDAITALIPALEKATAPSGSVDEELLRPSLNNQTRATEKLIAEVERTLRRLRTGANSDGELIRLCELGEETFRRWREKNLSSL